MDRLCLRNRDPQGGVQDPGQDHGGLSAGETCIGREVPLSVHTGENAGLIQPHEASASAVASGSTSGMETVSLRASSSPADRSISHAARPRLAGWEKSCSYCPAYTP